MLAIVFAENAAFGGIRPPGANSSIETASGELLHVSCDLRAPVSRPMQLQLFEVENYGAWMGFFPTGELDRSPLLSRNAAPQHFR
jgi:hypothetical protein